MPRRAATSTGQPGKPPTRCAGRSTPSCPTARTGRLLRTFHLGDILRLKKPHPCGGSEWEVVGLPGTDATIKCLKCHRRVVLSKAVLERRVKGPRDPSPDIRS
ncbi:MAG TPA: DUF951 domain-containing protein [Dehalococcoidia bacterium]|nr:DUF951 domain-containing protein [Dehalococcoidia bacterium]